MSKTHNIARYEYAGISGCQSVCRLEIWGADTATPVVLVTERLDNDGTSVTNWAEHLAEQVCREYRLDPTLLWWLECYEREDDGDDYHDLSPHSQRSEFDRVIFQRAPGTRLHSPEWTPYGLERAEQLVGEAL